MPTDGLSFLIKNSEEDDRGADNIALLQLVLSLAAIHTTSMTFLNMIYDLCDHPEAVGPLRDEIERELPATGIIEKTSISKLRKMDSFMKESQRLSPLKSGKADSQIHSQSSSSILIIV